MGDHGERRRVPPRSGATLRSLALLLLVACGDNRSSARDAAPARDGAAIDASPSIDAPTDAPELAACANPVAGTKIRFRRIGDVDDFAVLATAPRGDRRLFVVEKQGVIRIFDETEQLLPAPFLDLSEPSGGPVTANQTELGLLGLAFHPEYAANGQFFVFYTHLQSPAEPKFAYRNILARCQRSAADPDRAEPACVEVLSIRDFGSNHNGGMIEFGPDGLLYIGTGDGGGSGDPRGNAQTLVDGAGHPDSIALLGKMLRIDVDHKDPGKEYAIPAGNPFAAGGGAPEIYALGLRNPWRWSIDREAGDIWIGDAGQATIEEVTVVPLAELAGKNFGWNMWEGSRCFKPPCSTQGITFPQIERTRAESWSAMIGGTVYRGSCYPDLVGTYFYANFGTRAVGMAKRATDGTVTSVDLVPGPGGQPNPAGTAAIHADARGELYFTATSDGAVFHLEVVP